MSLKQAIANKLEERRAAEYLKKCKRATEEAIRDLMDKAEETGTDPQLVYAQYVGKTPTKADARKSMTEAEKTLAALRARHKDAAPAARPAAAKAPAPKSAYERYLDMRKTDPQGATAFFEENKRAIFTEADAGKGRQSPNH